MPLFCAGGIATPADAALMMQLGAEGNFVGSGIFKSEDPPRRARAIVEATTHFRDPERVAAASAELGEPMRGDDIAQLAEGELLPSSAAGEPRLASDRRPRLAGRLRGARADAALARRRARARSARPQTSTASTALVIPGGESTTIAKAIERDGLEPAIRAHAERGPPVLGTCAGLIMLRLASTSG